MITYLFTVLAEESGRVHAIRDGAADKGNPVENQRGLVGILDQDLLGDIEGHRHCDESEEGNDNLHGQT